MDFVKGQHGPFAAGPAGDKARGVPLLGDPLAAAQGRFVGRGVGRRRAKRFEHLAHERGLSDLSRAGDDLDEAPRLRQAAGQRDGMGPDIVVAVPQFTQHNE